MIVHPPAALWHDVKRVRETSNDHQSKPQVILYTVGYGYTVHVPCDINVNTRAMRGVVPSTHSRTPHTLSVEDEKRGVYYASRRPPRSFGGRGA